MENNKEVEASGSNGAVQPAGEASHFQNKISTDSDLTLHSLIALIEEYRDKYDEVPDILIVSSYGFMGAIILGEILPDNMRVISIPLLDTDAWAIAGSKGVFWSPGA